MNSIVIVGSGPSLTEDQIKTASESNSDVMVINDNYKLLPGADYLFAADLKWWYKNYHDVPRGIQCYTLYDHPTHLEKRLKGARERIRGVPWSRYIEDLDSFKILYHTGNSGSLGIQLACQLGYTKIILIGFDHQHTNGQRHWFGDHDRAHFNKNADDPERWVDTFTTISYYIQSLGIDLVNCSTETAITSCRRSTLNEEC